MFCVLCELQFSSCVNFCAETGAFLLEVSDFLRQLLWKLYN